MSPGTRRVRNQPGSKEEQTGVSRRRPGGGRVAGPKKRGETRAGRALRGLTPLRVERTDWESAETDERLLERAVQKYGP
jgi:hypothetical protein